MTDWDLMTEYIHDAMYEVDKAYAAKKRVQEDATPEALDRFLAQVQELTENLTNLETVLNLQETFALDKFAEWLRKGSGEQHRAPHSALP
ncbi:MAG TPA: hypothetical protein VKP08_00975 [Anaerolineales bacterium]|nr:hypothetical protein [Anaerolineales bacterium]